MGNCNKSCIEEVGKTCEQVLQDFRNKESRISNIESELRSTYDGIRYIASERAKLEGQLTAMNGTVNAVASERDNLRVNTQQLGQKIDQMSDEVKRINEEKSQAQKEKSYLDGKYNATVARLKELQQNQEKLQLFADDLNGNLRIAQENLANTTQNFLANLKEKDIAFQQERKGMLDTFTSSLLNVTSIHAANHAQTMEVMLKQTAAFRDTMKERAEEIKEARETFKDILLDVIQKPKTVGQESMERTKREIGQIGGQLMAMAQEERENIAGRGMVGRPDKMAVLAHIPSDGSVTHYLTNVMKQLDMIN